MVYVYWPVRVLGSDLYTVQVKLMSRVLRDDLSHDDNAVTISCAACACACDPMTIIDPTQCVMYLSSISAAWTTHGH